MTVREWPRAAISPPKIVGAHSRSIRAVYVFEIAARRMLAGSCIGTDHSDFAPCRTSCLVSDGHLT